MGSPSRFSVSTAWGWQQASSGWIQRVRNSEPEPCSPAARHAYATYEPLATGSNSVSIQRVPATPGGPQNPELTLRNVAAIAPCPYGKITKRRETGGRLRLARSRGLG